MQPAPLLPPEDPTERRARQFAMLHTLADHSMNAATVAAARAETQSDDPPAKAPDYHRIFAQHANLVRHIIALEVRLEAGPAAASRSAKGEPAILSDPRQTLLRIALHHAARNRPGRTQLCRTIDQRIEQELLDDPEHDIPMVEIFNTICADLDLPIEPDQLSDDFLYYGRERPKPKLHWTDFEEHGPPDNSPPKRPPPRSSSPSGKGSD